MNTWESCQISIFKNIKPHDFDNLYNDWSIEEFSEVWFVFI